MRYIIYYSTKGGVGKTTLAKLCHLTLTQNNHKAVVGDDTDPQQHYADWMEYHPQLIHHGVGDPDFFIYDTQGFHTDVNENLLKAAKDIDAKIIIPIRPVCSLRYKNGENKGQIIRTSDEVKEATRISGRVHRLGIADKCCFVLNGCDPRSKKDIALFTEELAPFNIKVCNKQFNQRKAFGNGGYTNKEIADMSELLLEVLL